MGADGPRPVTIVDAGHRKPMEIEVIVPVEDMAELGKPIDAPVEDPTRGPSRSSIWPAIHPKLLELIRAHRSTIVFVNARRMAERLAARLNELAEEDLVRAHHGSLAREQRTEVEDALKEGRLRAIVATSSLELGIDMGAVDLVIQVESPGSVASGLQRIGRAGHQVGEPSRGKIFPKFRGDLLEAAVVTQRMRAGLIEETHYPRNPLDVLAQQLVAMCAVDEWHVDELRAVIRRVANFAELSDDVFAAVLDLLSGRYPSDDFAELRPRLVWDRKTGIVRAREGAGRLAITNAGHDPRPRPLRRVPPRRHARRRAGRGDGVREPARRGVRPGRELVADRGHHARPRRGRARPGRAGQDAVLEGRQAGPSARARPRVGRVHARACHRTPDRVARAAAR